MKKIITLLVVLSATALMAQPSYKYLLAHMPEFSDGEALYRIKEYQTYYPKQAHPYYLMANIHYRTFAKEHPLLNYLELSSAIYNMILYYGNCSHFIHDESIKKEWYLETAVDGKVSEETIVAFTQKRLNEAKDLRTKVDELHTSYLQLVQDYDSCLMEMSVLSQHYGGEKEAQLLIDDSDMALLNRMIRRARQLPKEIERYKKALDAYPIQGYQPQFIFRPINYFRMEGMTTSDFLQNEVLLWDFVTWGETFLATHEHKTLPYLQSLEQEYMRQSKAWDAAAESKPNTVILNMIDYRDEGSAMAPLMQLQHMAVQSHAIEQQILEVDSVDADVWIVLLQQTYRINLLLNQSNQTVVGLAEQLEQPALKRKYAAFVRRFFPNEPLWGERVVSLWQNRLQHSYQRACDRVVLVSEGHEPVVRISENMEAVISDGTVLFRSIL